MTENEINEMAIETARLHTLETIETVIRAILGECKGAIEVLDAQEKPSYQILKRAAKIKRQAA